METITLDFTNCKYLMEVYYIIKEAYALPEYFGNNLSALWDCLRYSWEEDIHTKIVGLNTLPKDLREYMNRILEVFDDVYRENPNMTFEIVS